MNPFINLEEDFFSIDSLLFLAGSSGSKLVEDTATGNPVTFTTNVARPLKSCLASWQPHQSGSGDPSPQNVRPVLGMDGVNVWHTGKNLLDPSKCTKQGRDNLWWYASEGLLLKAGKYTFSFERNVTGFYVIDFNTGDNLRIRYNSQTDTFTLAEDHLVKINVYISGEVSIDEKAQLELGSTATDFTPYTGTTYAVEFPALGKNLLDPSRKVSEGNNVRYYRSGNKLPLKGGQTYTLTTNVTSDQLTIFDSNNTSLATTYSQSLTYTPTEDVNVWFDLYVSNAHLPEGGISAVYGMLELGDTAHSYEPYTRTIYGGSLDLATGVLTAEYVGITTTWGQSKGTRKQGGYQEAKVRFANRIIVSGESGAGIYSKCDIAKYQWDDFNGTSHFYTMIDNGVCIANVLLPEDLDDSTMITIVCKLTEPIVLATLTPQQITALIGNNTMWADADDLSVTYLKKG